MNIDNSTYRLTDPGKTGTIALIIGAMGLIFSVLGYFIDADRLFHAYLIGFTYWVSIGAGALFFVMLHHLTSAKWSVVLRRLCENMLQGLPVLAILFIPIILGMNSLFHWTDADAVAHDHLLQKKAPYLNSTFFIIRSAVYFLVWILLSRILWRTSLAQDRESNEKLIGRFKKISAPGMILFAFTISFAAFDWLMSLDPHWYSTIFGVYYFAGSLVAIISVIIQLVLHFNVRGILKEAISAEHLHDLGKLLFAFVILWAYMGFSQYFLIWYANIPEETIWYHHRWVGNWKTLSLIIVFGHFVFPFILLISRSAKRNPMMLGIMSLWLLAMRWVDLYWLVMPNHYPADTGISWIDFMPLIGIGGIFVFFVWRSITRHPLLPVNDPKLEESINFINN